jgi:hypothetical protein
MDAEWVQCYNREAKLDWCLMVTLDTLGAQPSIYTVDMLLARFLDKNHSQQI